MSAQVLQCIQEGRPLLLENLPEDIDTILDPVIGKQIIRRGKGAFLKIGDAEVEYDPNFRWGLKLQYIIKIEIKTFVNSHWQCRGGESIHIFLVWLSVIEAAPHSLRSLLHELNAALRARASWH